MSQQIELNETVPGNLSGNRLDSALAVLFPDYSRTRIKEWILAGEVRINGEVKTQPKEKVHEGVQVEIRAAVEEAVVWAPEAIDLDVVFEDEHILVINKPAGLVVHPGAGNSEGTLLNALLHHCPSVVDVPRAGIVHRLDKLTTGLMVVAKTIIAQTQLVKDLEKRLIVREYEAIVNGVLTAGGRVDAPIGRHPTKRINMAVVNNGKPAATKYRVAEKFRQHSRLRLRLESGRTHQIRVHMDHLGYPLVGDPNYGGRLRLPKHASTEFTEILRGFKRQALHARMLQLQHPVSCELLQWKAPTPMDMRVLTVAMRNDLALFQNPQD
ncbi:23S rRNA pseudouridine(1911/1915/1917) synthase RluD [Alginatibacterium sediminis]|uniref:Pseudouridine synthase n=1 Tax=Alginatibacterium sediminis TaxID=2164068 RepID=A0A420EJT2_9ALTE|nr:23S rRNA pseudouridine(1911/1915/1917) synthase RluD [Alginatibacterium sediminis]RKF20933.1 23S rRNA pseudouridine(1911/1915/1917) synthase RluD [Alginatibacterium sediminis]